MVPYRDSVLLTKLLTAECSCGNSKNALCATLIGKEKIKNQAVVNENPMDKLLRELQTWKKCAKNLKRKFGAQLMSNSELAICSRAALTIGRPRLLAEARADLAPVSEAADKKSRIPHLLKPETRIQCCQGVVVHFLESAEILIGRSEEEIAAADSPDGPGAKTLVNGLPLTGPMELTHKDRIGSNVTCIVFNREDGQTPLPYRRRINWEFVQKEIANVKGFATDLPVLLKGVFFVTSETCAVQMQDLLSDLEWRWERGKFMNRRFLMLELQATHPCTRLLRTHDRPFLGAARRGYCRHCHPVPTVAGLLSGFEDRLPIVDHRGRVVEGHVTAGLTPCDSRRRPPLGEDEFVEEPEDLLGRPLRFNVRIESAEVLRQRHAAAPAGCCASSAKPNQTLGWPACPPGSCARANPRERRRRQRRRWRVTSGPGGAGEGSSGFDVGGGGNGGGGGGAAGGGCSRAEPGPGRAGGPSASSGPSERPGAPPDAAVLDWASKADGSGGDYHGLLRPLTRSGPAAGRPISFTELRSAKQISCAREIASPFPERGCRTSVKLAISPALRGRLALYELDSWVCCPSCSAGAEARPGSSAAASFA
uniref:DUF4283 domain-containing protein n=1 Tax=Macrostomum lignano TaxID=282301 RepID=A0A1I8FMW7_9PLAT